MSSGYIFLLVLIQIFELGFSWLLHKLLGIHSLLVLDLFERIQFHYHLKIDLLTVPSLHAYPSIC